MSTRKIIKSESGVKKTRNQVHVINVNSFVEVMPSSENESHEIDAGEEILMEEHLETTEVAPRNDDEIANPLIVFNTPSGVIRTVAAPSGSSQNDFVTVSLIKSEIRGQFHTEAEIEAEEVEAEAEAEAELEAEIEAEVEEETEIEDQSQNQNEMLHVETGRKKKGRKRKFAEQNRQIKKQKTNKNEKYINTKGVIVEPKVFTGETFNCNCPKKCTERLSVQKRRAEFNKFWNAGHYETRCCIIQGNVKEVPVSRHYARNSGTEKVKRVFSRLYQICNEPVCKKAFLNTYQISQTRVDIALKKNKIHEIKDKRGSAGGKNRTPDHKINEVVNFISQFPIDKTVKSTKRRYVAGNMSLQKMYNIYSDTHINPVTLAIFKKVFYEKFNLYFKKAFKTVKQGGGRKKSGESSDA